jgi:hypothetical protein
VDPPLPALVTDDHGRQQVKFLVVDAVREYRQWPSLGYRIWSARTSRILSRLRRGEPVGLADSQVAGAVGLPPMAAADSDCEASA